MQRYVEDDLRQPGLQAKKGGGNGRTAASALDIDVRTRVEWRLPKQTRQIRANLVYCLYHHENWGIGDDDFDLLSIFLDEPSYIMAFRGTSTVHTAIADDKSCSMLRLLEATSRCRLCFP